MSEIDTGEFYENKMPYAIFPKSAFWISKQGFLSIAK